MEERERGIRKGYKKSNTPVRKYFLTETISEASDKSLLVEVNGKKNAKKNLKKRTKREREQQRK